MNQKKASERIIQNQNNNSDHQNNVKPTLRNLDNNCNTCPEKKCETCPKDKCCINDKEEVSLPNEQKDIISQEVKPEENLPLEEFKASIDNQNVTSDITEAEKDTVELHE